MEQAVAARLGQRHRQVPLTKSSPETRGIDRSPKVTIVEAADLCKVEAGWLGNFVGRAGVRVVATYTNPTRRYYSLRQIKEALRKERRGLPS